VDPRGSLDVVVNREKYEPNNTGVGEHQTEMKHTEGHKLPCYVFSDMHFYENAHKIAVINGALQFTTFM
jgi:hypothetical protein